MSYADILTTVYGIQKYNQDPTTPGAYFNPITNLDLTLSRFKNRSAPENVLRCPLPLLGELLFVPTPWAGVPLWGALQPYLNPAINEMYTALKVHPDGSIQPTLTVRQIPFNSDFFVKSFSNATAFSSLPRWHIPNSYVTASSLGTSDALRFNYVKVFAQPSIKPPLQQSTEAAYVKAKTDETDAKRNGLSTYLQTLTMFRNAISGEQDAGQVFTNLVADRVIGAHLRLSGTIQTKGIDLPIAVGDNIYYRDYVFHIESITHSLYTSIEGQKSFDTTLNVSNGVPDEDDLRMDIINGSSMEPALVTEVK